jgi:hypothetical protein
MKLLSISFCLNLFISLSNALYIPNLPIPNTIVIDRSGLVENQLRTLAGDEALQIALDYLIIKADS